MLCIWISLAVAVIGVVCIVVYARAWGASFPWFGVGLACLIVGIVCTLTFGGIAVINEVYDEQYYQETMFEREAIVYRLEHIDTEQNLNINGGVYDDVIEFNKNLLSHKTWTHNPWIGSQWPDKIAEIDYIELPNINLISQK
jgi:hypothetical protein